MTVKLKLPLRKCFHIAKVLFIVGLVVSVLTLFEIWRGGKTTLASQRDEVETELERQVREDEARIVPGLGEGGVAAYLSGEDDRLGKESEKKMAMNVYLSDRIAYNRTLKDYRNPACSRVMYDAQLPSVSVVIIFHNEPYSVVLRTVWSVLNSARRDRPWYQRANYRDSATGERQTLGYRGQPADSPYVYLKEIILVDDNSTLPELKDKLSHYVRTRMPPDMIRILRLPDRIGLTQARLSGARQAVGEAIVFLDAHCEAGPDWLRPLLQRLKEKHDAVLTPLIDMLTSDNLEYQSGGYRQFEGLMAARITGARAARGEALVFLDAHCEAGSDWLRPLLQRLRGKRDAVVAPLIDVLGQDTLRLEAADNFQVGGFTFNGHFTWIDIPEWEKKRRGSDINPTWSPTMAGGLFAMSRSYFWQLGAYDEQMAGWGGENLEMSFRIWQCGGTLETVPCSRVGHVFRRFHPYSLPDTSDTHGINTARMAEVWMDDYKELFYLNRPDLRKNPKIGDVTHRKILREKLQCKSFQWYLDHVYREKFVPVRDVYGYGRFRNKETDLCLDTLQREEDAAKLGVYACHSQLQATQHLSLSLRGELRDEERCAEVRDSRGNYEALSRPIVMTTCHGKERDQKWRRLEWGGIQHARTGLCLTAGPGSGADVSASPCDSASPAMRWTIDYSEENDFVLRNDRPPTEQELKLRSLRGQKRISRSLLSVSDEGKEIEKRASHKKEKKKHSKRKSKAKKKSKRTRKVKDKFMLKIVRSLPNKTEDHLEVDIHCKHRKLYPNNTFVRDLVTILNNNDIKVINNGRIFEKDRVTDLSGSHGKASEQLTPKKVLEKLPIMMPDEKRARKKTRPSPAIARDGEVEGENHPLASPPSSSKGGESKRIIIEDFVEIKSSTELPPALTTLKKKRKKQRRPETAVKDVKAQEQGYPDVGNDLRERAAWDGASDGGIVGDAGVGGGGRGAGGGAEEDEEEVTHRDNGAVDVAVEAGVRKRMSSGETSEDSSSETAAPVKLVLKSNLTFNLGDEFFKWRQSNDVVSREDESQTMRLTTKAAPVSSEYSEEDNSATS